MKQQQRSVSIRKITCTAIMTAVASLLMILEFSLPFVPSFLKFDFSDLPAVITSFAIGPVWGMLVELLKNAIHLAFSHTNGVGELANFLVGAALTLPAGIVYRIQKTRGGAVCASLAGTLFAAAVSYPVNLFITYPFYSKLMPIEAIVAMYKVIFPSIDTLEKALLFVNLPFTFGKGTICVVLTFLVYKKLSPILKGKEKQKNVTKKV